MMAKLRAKTIYFRDTVSPIVEQYMIHHGIESVSDAVNHIFENKGKLSRAEIIQNHTRK